MGKKKGKFSFNSSNILVFIWRNRIFLLLITGFAIVVSVITSLSLTPKYKSAVVMFPASSASVSGTLLTESAFATNEILKFGGETEAEQLMQVLHSSEIRSRVMKKYNLAHHYGIDTSSKSFYYSLNKTYDSNIKFRRTEFLSIVVEVIDENADTAALIANDIAQFVDTAMNQIIHDRALKSFELVGREYGNIQQEIVLLQDSLRKIREKGILNYDAQSQSLTAAYATALRDGNTGTMRKIETQQAILAKYGGNYTVIKDLLDKYTERFAVLSAKYQQAKVDMEQNLPRKYIVEKAYPSDRKAWPVRWVIVVVSAFTAFFMALVALLIRDSFRKAKD